MSAAAIAAQAAADKRRGAALVHRFANAVATWHTGETAEVIFDRVPDLAQLGGLQVAVHQYQVEGMTAEIPAHVRDGSSFTVAMGDAPTVSVGTFRVQRGGRTDDVEEATTTLAVERA